MMKINNKLSVTFIFCLVLFFSIGTMTSYGADPKVSAKIKKEAVNLNTAEVKELSVLPGIGLKKAEAIVAYRTDHGSFSSVENLLKVKGIGKKVLEKIKPMVKVEVKGKDMPKAMR